MISESTLKQIAKLFCGDTEGYYTYKSGPQLIDFFNTYYAAEDYYYNGFPSRWAYVYDKLVELQKANQLDGFLDIILSKEYLIREQSIGTVAAAEKSAEILEEIRRILQADQYTLVASNGKHHMIEENKDFVLIGEGGFANVYKQNSTGLIKKQLKDEYLPDKSLRSRFKREYEITKSLQDLKGVIKVYSFSEDDCAYTMEPADATLEQYVTAKSLPDSVKLMCIRMILSIMSKVHARGVIHRDLSPNNIFVVSRQIKIADFGLGKDLNVQASHKTYLTRGVGQYLYCAPEQQSLLRESDKRSDVYSLGRVINFIMTGDPRNSHHVYRSVSEKATVEDPDYRFADASQLSEQFEKTVEFQSKKENKEQIENKIRARIFDSDVENYICDMEQEHISRCILDRMPGFVDALLTYMKKSEANAQYIIQSVDQTYRDVCSRSFEANDPFALFADSVLRGQYSYVVKETAAQILSYIAWIVNRYNAQGLVHELEKDGIDPMLEDIIRGKN